MYTPLIHSTFMPFLQYVALTSLWKSPTWLSPWRECWRWWLLFPLILLSQRYISLSYVYMHLRWVTEWRRAWLSGHLQKNDINIFDLSLLLEIVLRALYNTVKLSLIINSRLSFVWSKVNHSLRKQISEQKLHIPCCWVYARPLHLSRTSIQFSQCRLIRTERRPR